MAVLYLGTAIRCGVPIRIIPPGLDFRTGDILLLGSSTLRGRIVKALDGGTSWAHVALIASASGNDVWLVHADPQAGVVKESLSEYLLANNVDALMLLRVSDGTPAAGAQAAEYAEMMAERKTPFDDLFRYKQGERIYCTELVLVAWERAGIAILPEAQIGERILPSALTKSPVLLPIARVPSEQ